MPPNLSGIYMSSFKEIKKKLTLGHYYFVWATCLHNRERGTDLVYSSLNIYYAIIWLNSSSSSVSFLVEIDMRSSGK